MKATKSRNRAANGTGARRKKKPDKQAPPSTGPENAANTNAGYMDICLEQFAGALDTARTLWRTYPELVEASDFPEPFLSACSSVESGLAGEEDLLQAGILKAQQATDEQKRFEMPTPKELRAKLKSIRESVPDGTWPPEAEQELRGYLRSIVDLSHDDERNFIPAGWGDLFTGEKEEGQRKGFVTGSRNRAIEFLATCRVIHYADDDENTPAEHLIEKLVFAYLHKGGLRPEGVQEMVDQFVRSFEWELSRAKRAIQEYPDLFTPEALERELV